MKIKPLTLLAVVAFAGLQPQTKAQVVVVDLGSAKTFAVLAGSAVTANATTYLDGDLGLWPVPALSGSPTVTGTTYLGGPVAEQAQSDLTTAYNYAKGQTVTGTVATELAGSTLLPGVYDSLAGTFSITGELKLDAANDPNAVWIFKMATTLDAAANSKVTLLRSAQAGNVFWQVGTAATIGATTDFSGSILAGQTITVGAGTDVLGRLLAQNAAVTLDDDSVVVPGVVVPEPAGTFVLFAGLSGLVIGVRRIRRHSQNPVH